MAKSPKAPADEPRKRRPIDDDDDRPTKKGRAADDDDEDEDPLVPRKKKKSAAKPAKIGMTAVASVVGAVAVFIMLYWVYSPMGTDSSMLCYCPPETTTLIGMDVEDLVKNKQMKEFNDLILGAYKGFSEARFANTKLGIDKGVQRYLHANVATADAGDANLDPQDRRGYVTVIRLKDSVNRETFVASFNGTFKAEERQSKDGKPYYQLYRAGANGERLYDISFFFGDDRTLVYTSSRRECEEALARDPGRVELDGPMRDLASKVDGSLFIAQKGTPTASTGPTTQFALGFPFLNTDIREPQSRVAAGTATWCASNGNDFLYANAILMTDAAAARDLREKLATAFDEVKEKIWQEDAKPDKLEEVFFPKPAAGAAPGFSSQQKVAKDAAEALVEYVKYSSVTRRGNLVVVEGRIGHEKFGKMLKQVNNSLRPGGGFGGPGGGMPGMPGMPGGGGGPPGRP